MSGLNLLKSSKPLLLYGTDTFFVSIIGTDTCTNNNGY